MSFIHRIRKPGRGPNPSALEFDGVGDYVVGYNNIIPSEDDFTISMWANVAVVASGSDLVGVSTSGDDALYLSTTFGSAANQVRLWDRTPGELLVGSDIRGIGWTYIVVTRKGNQFVLYENAAISDSSESNASVFRGSSLYFGCLASITRFFNGTIDDVRIYNRALPASEIQQLYNLTPQMVSTSGLVGHWKFDEGTGLIARDYSGNGNHGTMTGVGQDTVLPDSGWETSGWGDYLFFLRDYIKDNNWPVGELDYESDGTYVWVGGGYYGTNPEHLYVEVPNNVGVDANDANSFMAYLTNNPITVLEQDMWTTDTPYK